jgi:hypothetical protein
LSHNDLLVTLTLSPTSTHALGRHNRSIRRASGLVQTLSVSSIGTRAADAALWLTVELLFTHSQQTGRRLALKSKYLIDPNL